MILEQLSVFWANTEVVLDLLTKKGQHVEQFIGFASKPKLMARFRERIEEYKRFWEGVSIMSSNYITGVGAGQMTRTSSVSSPGSATSERMYGFLEKDGVESSSGKVYYRETPPSSASKGDTTTPPPSASSQTNSNCKVRRESDLGVDSNSFDSMGGIFSYIGSLDKSSPLRDHPRSSTH